MDFDEWGDISLLDWCELFTWNIGILNGEYFSLKHNIFININFHLQNLSNHSFVTCKTLRMKVLDAKNISWLVTCIHIFGIRIWKFLISERYKIQIYKNFEIAVFCYYYTFVYTCVTYTHRHIYIHCAG